MMGMFHCDGCWDRPCTCGLEAKMAADFRRDFAREFPPHPAPAGEEWDFPTVREMADHPDFMERKRRKAEGKP